MHGHAITPTSMSRPSCGAPLLPSLAAYKLANDGHDTRALQHYMGRKNIMHTVRYTGAWPA